MKIVSIIIAGLVQGTFKGCYTFDFKSVPRSFRGFARFAPILRSKLCFSKESDWLRAPCSKHQFETLSEISKETS